VLLDIAVTEVAKTVAASLAGSAIAGGGRLLKLLRRKMTSLPRDPARLATLIMRHAREDPAFAAEIFGSLAALGNGGAGAMSPFPPDPFVDRDELRSEVARSTCVWVIAGQFGVGKTAFVRRIAHDVAERFPGGQVYIDLDEWRDGDALRVAEIERHVLGQVGVSVVEAAAPDVSQQYLGSLLRRRFVLVLENAVGVEEVSRLAQPWPCSLVLVTTRMLTDELRIWSSPDRLVELHGVDEAGAWDLLASRCGEAMLAAEPDATRRLLRLGDWMPFAILQFGSMLARRAGEPGAVAAVLAEFRSAPDSAAVIQLCLDRTFDALSPSTVDGLLALASHPGEEFTYTSAEAMLGRPARPTLDELMDACLIERAPHGRLRLHRLVRDYADRLARRRAVDPDPHFDRVLSFYRDRAVAADLSEGDRLRCYPIPRGLSTWSVPGVNPIDWLEIESGTIVDLIKQAYGRRRNVAVVQLCGALEVLLNNRGYHWRCAEAFDWGIASAKELGEPRVQARLHAMQGRLFTLLHVFDRAAAELDIASNLLADARPDDDGRPHDAGPDDTSRENARLASSVLEFHGRLHEEMAEHQPAPEYSPAIACLRRAVDIDRRAGLSRGLGLHLRMLANLLVKVERPQEAKTLLEEALDITEGERNRARVQMVLTKAYTKIGDLARARAAVAQARALVGQVHVTQYDLELADIEAEIAFRAGEVEVARARWGWVADRYCDWGHPKFSVYLAKLDQLPPPPQ
jgi:tetratricopeptide (TPR) repeat protein